MGADDVEQGHPQHRRKSDPNIVALRIVRPHGRHQGRDVEPISGDAAPQPDVLVGRERDDAVPEFAHAVRPHERFLALHPECTGDALRRK